MHWFRILNRCLRFYNGQLITEHHDSLQDEIFQKFNFDTEWAVKLISRITNDEDIPIEGDTIVKQVIYNLILFLFIFL